MARIIEKLRSLPEQVRVNALGRVLGVSGNTVRRWAEAGLLPKPVRIGPKSTLFSRDEVLAHLLQLEALPSAS
jgi:predicted DNA-binding transcriptional regulator AlpA